jgi:VWFA-related protein
MMKMRKGLFFPILLLAAALFFLAVVSSGTSRVLREALPASQALQHTTGVVNVEVPVRVFDGDKFVDNLTLDDFLVYENGKRQSVAALYLVRKTEIQKEESAGAATTKPVPKTRRNIVLLFEVNDPMPKLDEAVDYFFDKVFLADDRVAVATPHGTYHLKPETVASASRPEIAKQLKSRLRKDIIDGSSEYKQILRDIRDLQDKFDIDADLKEQMLMDYVRRLRDRISLDESRLRQFAAALKTQEGQKYVFLFYQRERIVLPPLSDFASTELYKSLNFNPQDVEHLFADASLTVHFIYLTQSTTGSLGIQDSRRDDTLRAQDITANVYAAFREMAQASGGLTEATGNPLASFQKAVMASENYYLLYYVPKDYQADGKFKEIKVMIKGRSYRVTNRAGYFAN